MFHNETDAAQYIFDFLEGKLICIDDKLFCHVDGNWISNRYAFHRFCVKQFRNKLDKWVLCVTKFNKVWHMLKVLASGNEANVISGVII